MPIFWIKGQWDYIIWIITISAIWVGLLHMYDLCIWQIIIITANTKSYYITMMTSVIKQLPCIFWSDYNSKVWFNRRAATSISHHCFQLNYTFFDFEIDSPRFCIMTIIALVSKFYWRVQFLHNKKSLKF